MFAGCEKGVNKLVNKKSTVSKTCPFVQGALKAKVAEN